LKHRCVAHRLFGAEDIPVIELAIKLNHTLGLHTHTNPNHHE